MSEDMDITERLRGPHEWGYRCLADGGFVADPAPSEAADIICRYRRDKTFVFLSGVVIGLMGALGLLVMQAAFA